MIITAFFVGIEIMIILNKNPFEMRQKYILLSLALSLMTTVGWSQFPQSTQARSSGLNFESNNAANKIMRSRDILQEIIKKGQETNIRIEEIEGEPYFDTRFTTGTLMYKDSISLGEFQMRYHAYADEMEISNPDGKGFLNKADYLRVKLRDETYRPLNFYNDKGTIVKGFFVEKTLGDKASLYLRKFMTVKDGEEAKTSFHKDVPPKFIEHQEYYLKLSGNPPQEIKLKKSRVLKSFPEHIESLKKYVSQQNLNLGTEQGIVNLVNYYNSL